VSRCLSVVVCDSDSVVRRQGLAVERGAVETGDSPVVHHVVHHLHQNMELTSGTYATWICGRGRVKAQYWRRRGNFALCRA
jgi:hypothetical protein